MSLRDQVAQKLTDDELNRAIGYITGEEHTAGDIGYVRSVIMAAIGPDLDAAEQPKTCATCKYWGNDPVETTPVFNDKHKMIGRRLTGPPWFRARCDQGVSGSSAEKASHHPYPITRCDFGCTLWEVQP